MEKTTLTRAEIEKYWGSMEAYEEEQRRCGLYAIEAAAKNEQPTGFGFRRATIGNEGSFRKVGARTRFSLRFFGQRA